MKGCKKNVSSQFGNPYDVSLVCNRMDKHKRWSCTCKILENQFSFER